MACGLLALATFFLLLRDSEPSYKGKSLSTWLAQMYADAPNEGQRLALRSEARDAIKAIGTNTLPYLVEGLFVSSADLANEFSRPRTTLRTTIEKALTLERMNKLHAWLYKQRITPFQAVDAFKILGPTAAPAIPALTNLLTTSTNFYTVDCTAQSLANIGPLAISSFIHIVTNQHSTGRGGAIRGIGYLGPQAAATAPILIKCLNENDPAILYAAVATLGELDVPGLAVPALTNLLLTLNASTNANFALVTAISQSLKQCGLTEHDLAPALNQYINAHRMTDLPQAFPLSQLLSANRSPEIYVPVLADYLISTNSGLSQWSWLLLTDLGHPALPALTNALQNSTGTLHVAISNTIDEIVFPRSKPQFE